MSGVKGFPIFHLSGIFWEMPFIIQQKLGSDLEEILEQKVTHFTLKCVVSIGISLVNLLEKLHEKGYIHNDLKPDNVMIGDPEDPESFYQIHLIDFGLSTKFLNEDGSHVKQHNDVNFRGNTIFSSKNAFMGITLSRRDDIISLVYMLIYFIHSDLTWIERGHGGC